MLYYLADYLTPRVGLLNVLTYLTVRAGAAAITAFLVSVAFGPVVIDLLRRLKVGQYIRKEHVDDLHELHKVKAGTPTMGGTLMVLATLVSLVLWAQFTRLLVVAAAVFVALAAVGFVDDFIKLRRKNNHGLSAKAKFAGQILTGVALGLLLYLSPVTGDRALLEDRDVLDWQRLAYVVDDGPLSRYLPMVRPEFSADSRESTAAASERGERAALLSGLNRAIGSVSFYDPETSPQFLNGVTLSADTRKLIAQEAYAGNGRRRGLLNRLILSDVFPETFRPVTLNLHTKLEVPGFKRLFLPLGVFYVLFVMLVIVGSSNAVNLTDGLDGLAVGASIMSLLAYTGIAYTVSRADWSGYLFLLYVPEASELSVFGATLLGAGLGFLWFNSHPAEVFMGDTGSLALGGAIGTMAILTKQELLLLLVGGLFVLEAASVIIQVASFKLRRKRVFRMAPLHHHFELKGWSETKVVVRFWILALIFALLSLGTLKLR